MFALRVTIEFDEWLQSLRDTRARTAILRRLRQAEQGNFGDHKNLGGGLWEMRIHLGPGYRVYYAFEGQYLIIVIAGGDKSGQARDVQRARDVIAEGFNHEDNPL